MNISVAVRNDMRMMLAARTKTSTNSATMRAEEDEAAAENRLQQRFGAGHRIGRQRRQCERHSHPEIDVAEKRRARGIRLRGGKGRFGCFHFRVE